MAFDRKLLTGNTGAGSSAPAVYTYLGDVADLTVANIQSTDIKPNDVIIVVDVDQVVAPTVKAVTNAYALV